MQGPLDGITILDLTIYQNGPWSTVMLSDMGAEVIKVEDPVNGDPGRNLTPMGRAGRRVPTYFESMNRNKRSITLNLKSDDGREIFYDLAKRADVITQNFRVGVVERLKVDYETISKINPRIVYGSVSGLGSRGPEATQGVFDILGQARGGLMELLSIADPELSYRASGGLADQTGAITMAYGIMLALFERERTGKGQHVEVSQLSGQLMLQALALNGYLMNDEMPLPRPPGDELQPAVQHLPLQGRALDRPRRHPARPLLARAVRGPRHRGAARRPAIQRSPRPRPARRRAHPHHRPRLRHQDPRRVDRPAAGEGRPLRPRPEIRRHPQRPAGHRQRAARRFGAPRGRPRHPGRPPRPPERDAGEGALDGPRVRRPHRGSPAGPRHLLGAHRRAPRPRNHLAPRAASPDAPSCPRRPSR